MKWVTGIRLRQRIRRESYKGMDRKGRVRRFEIGLVSWDDVRFGC